MTKLLAGVLTVLTVAGTAAATQAEIEQGDAAYLEMAQDTSSNMEVIRGAYEALAAGDVPAVLATFAPDIEWNEAENFPYADGNPYVGPDAVGDLFVRLGSEWDYFDIVVEDLLDAGDNVVVIGRYQARHSASGAGLDAQFAHIWWLEGGKITRFQQYTDTAQATAVVAGT